MEVACKEEDIKRVKALHQWLISQEIPKHQWTPMLMMAIEYDIWTVSQGDPTMTLRGQLLVTEMLVSWSQRNILNV